VTVGGAASVTTAATMPIGPPSLPTTGIARRTSTGAAPGGASTSQPLTRSLGGAAVWAEAAGEAGSEVVIAVWLALPAAGAKRPSS